MPQQPLPGIFTLDNARKIQLLRQTIVEDWYYVYHIKDRQQRVAFPNLSVVWSGWDGWEPPCKPFQAHYIRMRYGKKQHLRASARTLKELNQIVATNGRWRMKFSIVGSVFLETDLPPALPEVLVKAAGGPLARVPVIGGLRRLVELGESEE